MSKSYSRRRRNILKNKIRSEIEKIENEDLSPYYKRLKKSAIGNVLGIFDDRSVIPLCFSGFGITPRNIISDQVRSIDIFPTIMDIINSPDIDNIRGRSLLPYLEGEKMDEVSVLIESIPPSPKSSTTNSVGIRTSKYKYFRDRNNAGKNIHLYDLIKDPLEEKNLGEELSDIVQKMENTLNEMRDKIPSKYEKQDKTDDDEIERVEKELRKLGYID